MESVDVVAKSVEEAIQQALTKLGKSRDEVEITVLSEGHKGLLGFVRGENARVRVKVRETESSPAEPPIKSGIVVAGRGAPGPASRQNGHRKPTLTPKRIWVTSKPNLLEVTGDDLGILIGRRGDTLRLQFLLNLMVGKQLNSWVRIVIDVEGYRSRRRNLRSLASRVAEGATDSYRPDPMPANERRIVHLALQGNSCVTTESHGFGEDRRVP